MTPLACDIQHRHQHGAFGMKTCAVPSAPLAACSAACRRFA
jgi:hypothetical protein